MFVFEAHLTNAPLSRRDSKGKSDQMFGLLCAHQKCEKYMNKLKFSSNLLNHSVQNT